MTKARQSPELLEIWRFVRGDTKPQSFERWLCSNAHLEQALGAALYLKLISADYGDRDIVYGLRQQMSSWARGTEPLRCQCITLSDLAIVDMGNDGLAVFKTLKREASRGDPFWWLSTYSCSECGEWWLVASEESQNDVFCMRRLREGEVVSITAEHDWPSDFDTYESLLRIGMEAGKSVHFADPLDSSLRCTIEDLARNRPGIRVSELAQLLNLDLRIASDLAHSVIETKGVTIEFDVA